ACHADRGRAQGRFAGPGDRRQPGRGALRDRPRRGGPGRAPDRPDDPGPGADDPGAGARAGRMTLVPKRPTIIDALLALEDCSRYGARFVSRSGEPTFHPYREVPSLEGVFDAEALLAGAAWSPVAAHPESPAFLQFSSGTTLEPKAVIVSHRGLLHNLEMMDSLFRRYGDADAEQGGVCWLPLY